MNAVTSEEKIHFKEKILQILTFVEEKGKGAPSQKLEEQVSVSFKTVQSVYVFLSLRMYQKLVPEAPQITKYYCHIPQCLYLTYTFLEYTLN